MRTPLVAGNWKMNLDLVSARALLTQIGAQLPRDGIDIAVCPPSVYIHPLGEVAMAAGVSLGAQDAYFEEQGAYTGEVSAAMLRDVGAKFVILGHSERRHTIGHLEDDWMINRKMKAARRHGLTPILCVGETLAQRQSGQTESVLTFQLKAGLVDFELKEPDALVIAYEPVWAIGTGQVATPEQAQQAHAHLRRLLHEQTGALAGRIRILYGGSVKPDNAGVIMIQPDVDGGLIGGASLKAADFVGIVKATAEAKSRGNR